MYCGVRVVLQDRETERTDGQEGDRKSKKSAKCVARESSQ